jgi:hypothetical protein
MRIRIVLMVAGLAVAGMAQADTRATMQEGFRRTAKPG